MTGLVEAIFVATRAGSLPVSVSAVRAFAGRGLEGDRYFEGIGSFSRWPGEGRAVSLIQRETLDALVVEGGPDAKAGQHRRNIVTAGIELQSLIGRQFRIGTATLRGTRECTVCRYLNRASGLDLFQTLHNRGGLRADITADGIIRPGDTVSVL